MYILFTFDRTHTYILFTFDRAHMNILFTLDMTHMYIIIYCLHSTGHILYMIPLGIHHWFKVTTESKIDYNCLEVCRTDDYISVSLYHVQRTKPRLTKVIRATTTFIDDVKFDWESCKNWHSIDCHCRYVLYHIHTNKMYSKQLVTTRRTCTVICTMYPSPKNT
jgi:hypothetical protein